MESIEEIILRSKRLIEEDKLRIGALELLPESPKEKVNIMRTYLNIGLTRRRKRVPLRVYTYSFFELHKTFKSLKKVRIPTY